MSFPRVAFSAPILVLQLFRHLALRNAPFPTLCAAGDGYQAIQPSSSGSNTAKQNGPAARPGNTAQHSPAIQSSSIIRATEKAPRTNTWGLNLLLSKLSFLVRYSRTRIFAAQRLSSSAALYTAPECECRRVVSKHAASAPNTRQTLGTRSVVSRHESRDLWCLGTGRRSSR